MQLIRNIGHEPVAVASDRDALEQIVINLIDNAIKYAADGERLTVELQQQGRRCVVRIKDNGPGIPTRSSSAGLRQVPSR